MVFNNDGTELYMLRASSQDITRYTLSTAFDISTATFSSSVLSVAAQETAPYDFVFNDTGTKLFVLGSSVQDINEYTIAAMPYPESTLNDGSLVNTDPLTITLRGGETFADTDNDNLLDYTTEYTISNLPAGLTSVLTLDATDTMATLTFTGNATNHLNAQDVSGLVFTFTDAAFTHGSAATVANSIATTTLAGINFEDGVLLSSSTPTDNATSVAGTANIVLTFNQIVDVETGNLIIKKTSDDTVFESIPV